MSAPDLLRDLRLHVAAGVSAEEIAATVAEWLRSEGSGWESRGQYEIKMGRERSGLRLRTAALAFYAVADDLTAAAESPAPAPEVTP